MEEQMKNKKNSKKRKRLKRKLASMTAMVLVLTVGMMGTMAYLSTVSNKKENTFTGSKGISLKLTEPNWDADGDDAHPAVKGEGRYDAENYTPGKTIEKDPTLTNSTTTDSTAQEWVALAITYQVDGKDVSYSVLKNLIKGIDFNLSESSTGVGDYWTLLQPSSESSVDDSKGYAIYIYNKSLGQNVSTRALFEKIEIKEESIMDGLNDVGLATGLKNLNDSRKFSNTFSVNGGLPSFKINVIGAAVKNEYYKWDSTLNSNAGGYTSDLAANLSELKDSDADALKDNLVEVLQKQLKQDNDLGYVTK